MGGFYKFDEAPDILSGLRRSVETGIGVASKNVWKLRTADDDSPIARIGDVPVGFQFGTYLGLKGPAAFAVDVLTDPLTYIPIFGLLNKGVRGIAGLTKAGVAATASRDIAASLAKHPAAAKLMGGLFDDAVELGVKGMPINDVLKNMRHGFQSAAAIAGNEEAQALVKEAFEKHQQALLLQPGKAQRRAFNEVERIMSKARKVIRNDSGAGRLTAEVFSKNNLQGFSHAIRMRQDAILAPLGETMAEQAYRGQRKLLQGFIPFSEFTGTGTAKEIFSITGAPLFGVADSVAAIGKAAGRPLVTGLKTLDQVARKAVLATQTVAKLSVTADDVVASANRAVEAATGRMFTGLRQEGGRLVAPGVWSSGTDPAQVFIKGSEGKSIPYMQATSTERIQAALHATGDSEAVADNFVAAIDTAKFEIDRFTVEARTMLQQIHGGGETGARMADARARLATLAWQSPVDEKTGINGAGLIPVVTQRISENGIPVPLVQFQRPMEAESFAEGATSYWRATAPEAPKIAMSDTRGWTWVGESKEIGDAYAEGGIYGRPGYVNREYRGSLRVLDASTLTDAQKESFFGKAWRRYFAPGGGGFPDEGVLKEGFAKRLAEAGYDAIRLEGAGTPSDVAMLDTVFKDKLAPVLPGSVLRAPFQSGADLNIALDVAKGVDPAIVAKPFVDEELLLWNTVAEMYHRMGAELTNEGLLEAHIQVYGSRIATLTPKGRALRAKSGKLSAALASAAEETALPEDILGAIKGAFDFNPPSGSAGKGFLKKREADWAYLLQLEKDGIVTLQHDALKAFNHYYKAASEVIYKQGYLKGLRGLGEDAFGRVVMNAKEVEEAGGLMRLSVTGPKQIGAGVFKASKETTPVWKYVPADSIVGFNTEGKRYFIREDIHSVLDKLPQFKPGGLFLSSDQQTGRFLTGLLAINAMSKRTKVSLSQFHKFVLAGSLVSDHGLGLFFRKQFNPQTGLVDSTLNLDVVKAAGLGGARGAAVGAAAGALVSDDPAEGAVGGAVAAFLPGAAYRSAKEFARFGAQIYGDAADIAITGIKSGLTLEIDDAGLTTMDRMVHAMGTTPIPRLTTGGARQRAFVKGAMQPVEYFDQRLWREFYPGAKIMAFGNLYAEAMAENVKRGLGMTAEQVAANVAHHVNRSLGGNVWRKLGVSPQFRRLMNGMWFAADWTTSNLLMARDVFVNLTPARTALAGAMTGYAANAVVNGFDQDNMTDKGALVASIQGAAGALAFRGAAFAFGQKIGKDIVRGTPLQEWMVRNTATLAEMRDIMSGAQKAYIEKTGKKFASAADPDFALFAVDYTKKELEKAGKFLSDEFIPGKMKSGADELTALYARRYAKNALIASVVMANVANYAMTGHFMWENKDGYKLDVQLPGKDSHGRNLYMGIGKQYLEPFEWVVDPGRRAKGKLSTLIQTGIDLGANQDFVGRPIIQMDGGILTQGYEAGKYALTEMFTPIPVQPLVEVAQGKKDIKPAVLSTLGAVTKTEFKKKAAGRGPIKAPSLSRPPAIGRTSLRQGEY